MGNLLLVLGALLLLVPAARHAYEELAYRRQAEMPPPSPVMMFDETVPAEERPGAADGTAGTGGGAGATGPGAATAPDGGAGSAAAGITPLYHIAIPRFGVTYAVGDGVDNAVLEQGPGHYPQTVLPGEVGNAALAGHRTLRGRPSFFYHLDRLEPGDLLLVHYPDRSLTFVVERVFVTDPYDLSVIDPTDQPTLTLTTCDPPGSDEMRLIVQARLQSPLVGMAPPN